MKRGIQLNTETHRMFLSRVGASTGLLFLFIILFLCFRSVEKEKHARGRPKSPRNEATTGRNTERNTPRSDSNTLLALCVSEQQ